MTAEDRAVAEVVHAIGAASAVITSEHLRAHLDREARFLRVVAGMPAPRTTRPYVRRD